MTSFNEDRFDLKANFQPTERTAGVSDFSRKQPTSRPKRDFEKVMKRRDSDEESAQETVLHRKKKTADKGSDHNKRDPDERASAALEGIASKEGYVRTDRLKEPGTHSEFLREQPDLAGIQRQIEKTEMPQFERAAPESRIQKIQEIVDQIVNKLYILKQEGKTETVVTLKYPPLFEGAELKLTEYNSAKGEFNITFTNLHPEAKALIDAQLSQNSLQKALELRGYVAHIVVATTEKEELITSSEIESRETREQSQREKEEDRGNQRESRR